MIIGNNFLKLYQPFTQTNKLVILRHPKYNLVSTPIITRQKYIQLLTRNIKFHIELLFEIKNEQLQRMLEKVCSDNPLDKINTNDMLITINLKDPNKEVNVQNRIPYGIEDVREFQTECKQLLEKGIIRESKSPHSAPTFYVENKNELKRGKRRMVINYKEMNKATIGDSYKLPRKDYIL